MNRDREFEFVRVVKKEGEGVGERERFLACIGLINARGAIWNPKGISSWSIWILWNFLFFFFHSLFFHRIVPADFRLRWGKIGRGIWIICWEFFVTRATIHGMYIYILFFSEILTINNSHFIKKLSRAIVQWIALEYFHESPIVYDNFTCKI